MTRLPIRLFALLLMAASLLSGGLAAAESITKEVTQLLGAAPAREESRATLSRQFQGALANRPAAVPVATKDLAGGLKESLAKSKPVPAPSQSESESSRLYHQILRGTGWVVVPVSPSESYTGTCVVIDKQRRLALTNHHVVRHLKKGMVLFPEYRDGQLVTKTMDYAQSGRAIPFKVLAVDSRRDLALLEMEFLPPGIVALPFASQRPAVGEELHSVGNSEHGFNFEGRLWTYRTEKVTLTGFAVLQEAEVQKGGPTEARMLLTTPAFAHGDSGGPIVNGRGELVGVVAAINAAGGWSIDLVEVRHFLADPQLRSLKEGVEGELTGEWKAHYEEGTAQSYFVASFGKDGRCEFYGVKTLTGEYNLAGEEIAWSLQESSIREKGQVTWTDANRFVVLVGKAKYTFERR